MPGWQAQLDAWRANSANSTGDWGDSADGKPLPHMTPTDAAILIAWETQALAKLITHYNNTGDSIYIENAATFGDVPVDGAYISVTDYLGKAVTAPGRTAEFRIITYNGPGNPFQGTAGPFVPRPSWDTVLGLVPIWQNAVDLCARYLSYPLLTPMTKDDTDAIIQVIDDGAFLMDKENELPADNLELLGSAISAEAQWTVNTTKSTVQTVAGLGGQALATAADVAGNSLGSFFSNFLSSAGIPALMLAAGAVFLAAEFYL